MLVEHVGVGVGVGVACFVVLWCGVVQTAASSDVAFKLSRLRMKMMTKKGLGQIFQMNLVYDQLARRLIMGNEFKRLAERARKDFREVLLLLLLLLDHVLLCICGCS